jgi:hypothetical protein
VSKEAGLSVQGESKRRLGVQCVLGIVYPGSARKCALCRISGDHGNQGDCGACVLGPLLPVSGFSQSV